MASVVKPEYVSYREFARRVGVHPTTIQDAVDKGTLTTTLVGGTKKLEANASMAVWNERRKSLEDVNPVTKARNESKAASETYKARILKLDYEKKKGELISIDEVKKQAFDVGRILRNAFLNIPPKISAELAVETNPRKVEAILDDEIRRAIKEMKRGKYHDDTALHDLLL